MKNSDKLKKLAGHLRAVGGREHDKRKFQEEDHPRDEDGKFIALDPYPKYAQEQEEKYGSSLSELEEYGELALEDISDLVDLKKSEQHKDLVGRIRRQALTQLAGQHGVKLTTPQETLDFINNTVPKVKAHPNAEDMYADYKSNPHHKQSNIMKYLMHRVENVNAYETPDGAKKADEDFINRRTQSMQLAEHTPKAKRALNDQYDLPYYHSVILKAPHLLHGLLEHRDELHQHLKNKQQQLDSGLGSFSSPKQYIKDIGGEPHVALYRGLGEGERKADPSVASYADVKQQLGGRIRVNHPHWVPLKNVWYSYNHGPYESHPNPRLPHQDEFLVTPHPLKEAYSSDVQRIIPPKPDMKSVKRASDSGNLFERMAKTVEEMEHATRGTFAHPTIAVKPAANPGVPADRPHIREDSQTEVNFMLEKTGEPTRSGRRADKIRSQIAKHKALLPLSKADKPKQGIVTQIKPQQGKMGIEAISDKPAPYLRRFSVKPQNEPNSDPLSIGSVNSDSVDTHAIGNGYFHHIAKKGNHTYHILSSDSNPYANGLAGIMTASHEGKNYIRAAYSNSIKDEHLDLLRSHIKEKDEHAYDEPIEVDPRKHSEKGWEGHHSDLINGLVPDKTLQAPPNTLSHWISFAGVKGDETPRVVAKEALGNWDRRKGNRQGVEERRNTKEDRRSSFLGDPKFTTAHREAAYSKLADEFFHLGQYVPRTTVFRHPLSNKPWSAMEFIKGATPITPETREHDLKEVKDNGDLYKLAIMNVILGNNDRHMNNMLKDPSGKIHLIDHGLTFDYGNAVRTTGVPQYVHHEKEGYSLLDEKIPESVHQWLWSLGDRAEFANKLKDMGAPHDIIMKAAQRLEDARGWSNSVHHGSKMYPNTHQGLKYLVDIMRARNFDLTPEEHSEIIEKIKDQMHAGIKGVDPKKVGDRNLSTVKANTVKPLDRTIEANPDSIRDAATIAPDQARVIIGDNGRAQIDHPDKEVVQRRPDDAMPVGKKRV